MKYAVINGFEPKLLILQLSCCLNNVWYLHLETIKCHDKLMSFVLGILFNTLKLFFCCNINAHTSIQ